MGPISVTSGLLLVAISVISFAVTQTYSITAWIPAFFGIPLILLGLLARVEKLRMHVMHLAALIGLFGFGGAAVMAVMAVVKGTASERPVAVVSQVAMAVVCLVFLVLCIKSFVDARRRRIASEAAASTSES